MRWGVLQFPGSCDERDALHACELAGGEARLIWHEERDLGGVDAVVVPGGFSYGDYLRAGAIARFSPAMEAVAEFAAGGRAGARDLQRLPGPLRGGAAARRAAAQRGAALRLPPGRADRRATDRIHGGSSRRALSIPVKHGEGRYYAPDEMLDELEANGAGRLPLRARAEPERVGARHRRGAQRGGNVLGLMPHPEHAVDALTGSTDGLRVFERSPAGGRRDRRRPPSIASSG